MLATDTVDIQARADTIYQRYDKTNTCGGWIAYMTVAGVREELLVAGHGNEHERRTKIIGPEEALVEMIGTPGSDKCILRIYIGALRAEAQVSIYPSGLDMRLTKDLWSIRLDEAQDYVPLNLGFPDMHLASGVFFSNSESGEKFQAALDAFDMDTIARMIAEAMPQWAKDACYEMAKVEHRNEMFWNFAQADNS